jgi:hypothetical protein
MDNGTTTVEEKEFKPPLPEACRRRARIAYGPRAGTGLHGGSPKTRADVHCLGLLFFVVGGIMATLIRVRLFFPNNKFLEPDAFNFFVTRHGTVMIFPRGHAVDLRFCELSRSVNDRHVRFQLQTRPAHHYGIGTLNSPASPRAANRRTDCSRNGEIETS